MNCANCKQHFDYATGKMYGPASNEPRIYENSKPDQPLYVKHAALLSNNPLLLNLLLQLESRKPQSVDTKELVGLARHYYENGKVLSPGFEMRIAQSFERYFVLQYQNKCYRDIFNDVETRLLAGTLSPEYLEQVILRASTMF